MRSLSRHDLHRFFHPRSVAVIGASPRPEHIAGRPVRLLQDKRFGGRIYPVNPRCREIGGLRCFESLEALPETPDVALVLLKAARVPDALEACARRSVPTAVVHASGFAETDGAGAELEARIRRIVASSELRVVGPNCYGSLNVLDRIPLGFALPFEMDEYVRGGAGLFSHSGAFGYGFMTIAMEAGVGFTYVLNSGNSVDIDVADMLTFLAEDADTRVVAAYVEGIRDPEAFEVAAEQCVSRGKPIVLLRAGHSSVSRRAIRLHTGADGESDERFDGAVERLGIHMARDSDEFLDILIGLDLATTWRHPVRSGEETTDRGAGRGVAVITTSGASGILFADAAAEHGVELPSMGPDVREALGRVLPPYATSENPIDITAMVLSRPALVSEVVRIVTREPAVGCVVLMFSTPSGSLAPALLREVEELMTVLDRPAIAVITGGFDMTRDLRELLRDRGVPVFQSPHRAARAAGVLLCA